jgi:hypothetical protein
MFLRLGYHLIKAPEPKNEQEQVLTNAFVESFVIHLRNLTSFIYSERIESKDIIAVDFVRDPGEWYQKRPAISKALKRARERSHKEVVHLTIGRIAGAPPEKHWPVSTLMREMRGLMKQFADLASPQRLDPSVKELLTKPMTRFTF